MQKQLIAIRFLFMPFLAWSLAGYAAEPAPDEEPYPELRPLLAPAQKAKAFPPGLTLRLDAQLLHPLTEKEAAAENLEKPPPNLPGKAPRETWEFTADRVYRVVADKIDDELVFRRVAERPLNTDGLSQQLLEAEFFKLDGDMDGESASFLGTGYRLGHRFIEFRQGGEVALMVGESCFWAGYPRKKAEAFARLYEELVEQAESAFSE